MCCVERLKAVFPHKQFLSIYLNTNRAICNTLAYHSYYHSKPPDNDMMGVRVVHNAGLCVVRCVGRWKTH